MKRSTHLSPLPRALLPPALVLAAFLLLPIAAVLLATPPARLWQTARELEVLSSLALTLTAALVATAAALFGGLPLAFVLARSRGRPARLVRALLDLPLVLPHTAAGIALLLAFSRQAPAGSVLAALGLPFASHPVGIAAAMTFVAAPYLTGAAHEAFVRQGRRYERVARTLGATPWQAFRHVALPLAAPAIAAGAAQMWARAISEFGAIMIVAYHPRVLSVLLWDRFETNGLEAATPLAALLLVLSAAILLAARLLAARLPATDPAP